MIWPITPIGQGLPCFRLEAAAALEALRELVRVCEEERNRRIAVRPRLAPVHLPSHRCVISIRSRKTCTAASNGPPSSIVVVGGSGTATATPTARVSRASSSDTTKTIASQPST